jgi:uncharacterized iron-regulated membrane protein
MAPQPATGVPVALPHMQGVTAQVLAVELYSNTPVANRFIQAMSGLHYGEWGGIVSRIMYGLTGLAIVPLFFTGFTFWWLGKFHLSDTDRRPKSKPSGFGTHLTGLGGHIPVEVSLDQVGTLRKNDNSTIAGT